MSPKGLLDAAQQARTPTDRDRERVFAAMLASSMTSAPPPVSLLSLPQPAARPEPQAQALPPAPVRLPQPARAPQPTPHMVAPSLPPPRVYLGWAAAACVALVMGTASYIMLSSKRGEPLPVQVQAAATMAEEGPRPTPVAGSPVTVEDVTQQVMPPAAPPPAAEEPARGALAAGPARAGGGDSAQTSAARARRRHIRRICYPEFLTHPGAVALLRRWIASQRPATREPMTPHTLRLTAALVVLTGAAVLSGCGPLRSTAYILDAEVQIEAARTAGAEKYSPYQYTLAQLYIKKAREVVGFSDYEVGVGFAQNASESARAAKEESMAAAAKTDVAPSFNTAPAEGAPPDRPQQ